MANYTYAGQWTEALLATPIALLPSQSVTVKNLDGTLATLYTNRTLSAGSNPLTTDTSGNLSFFALPGAYNLSVTVGGTTTVTPITVPVDPSDVHIKQATSYTIYCDNAAGSDSNDGKSMGAAKLTLAAALAALPAGGGEVLLNTRGTGYYDLAGGSSAAVFTAPVTIRGLTPEGATVRRTSSGDLFVWKNAGGLNNITLTDDGLGSHARTGAAIKCMADSTSVFAQSVDFTNVRITSTEALGSWERCVHIDGRLNTTSGGNGCRRITFKNLWCFGGRTIGETIGIADGVHVQFWGGGIFAAPTSIAQGVKIFSFTGSTDVHFAGFENLGDFYSEGQYVTVAGGRIGSASNGTAPVTFAATANDSAVVTQINAGTTAPSNLGTNCAILDVSKGNNYAKSSAFTMFMGASSTAAYNARVVGDAVDRFRARADGGLFWGDGTNALDVHVNRTGTDILTVTGALVVSDALTIKIKAGTPADGDFLHTPPDGTLALDSTNHRLYIRDGGAWKYAALT